VSWIVPSDGITVLDRAPQGDGEFGAQVLDARHLGEITLATLALPDVAGAQMRLMVSGPQRRHMVAGSALAVRVDLTLVHVMPQRAR
jgi:molybdate transport system ATP-binding protein